MIAGKIFPILNVTAPSLFPSESLASDITEYKSEVTVNYFEVSMQIAFWITQS